MKKKNKKFTPVPFQAKVVSECWRQKFLYQRKYFLKIRNLQERRKSFHESWTAFLNGGFPVYFLYLSIQ